MSLKLCHAILALCHAPLMQTISCGITKQAQTHPMMIHVSAEMASLIPVLQVFVASHISLAISKSNRNNCSRYQYLTTIHLSPLSTFNAQGSEDACQINKYMFVCRCSNVQVCFLVPPQLQKTIGYTLLRNRANRFCTPPTAEARHGKRQFAGAGSGLSGGLGTCMCQIATSFIYYWDGRDRYRHALMNMMSEH